MASRSPRRRGGYGVRDGGEGNVLPLIRAASLGWLIRASVQTALANVTHKARVVKEVLETEETYYRTLEVIVNHYEEPARTQRLLKPHSHALIFCNINILRNEHRLLLDALRARRSEQSNVVSTALLAHLRRDLYSVYCATFEDGVAALVQDRASHSKLNPWFNNAQAASGLSIDLPALLIQPVQRVPRYRLLLLEIEKLTHPQHPDMPSLRAAITHTEALAMCVDGLLFERKRREALEALEKRLTGKVPKDFAAGKKRTLIREGELVKVCRKDTKPRRFVLLSDVLLYGRRESQPGDRVMISMALPLHEMRVEEAPDPLPGLHFAIRILHPNKSFVVLAPDHATRVEWLEAVSKAAEALTANANARLRAASEPVHAAVWVPDEAAPLCQRCGSHFSLVSRRHHCRQCGACVCNDCSKKRWKLQHLGNEPQRVCEACYRALSGGGGISGAFGAAARHATHDSTEAPVIPPFPQSLMSLSTPTLSPYASPQVSPRGPIIPQAAPTPSLFSGSSSAPTSPHSISPSVSQPTLVTTAPVDVSRWSPRGPSLTAPSLQGGMSVAVAASAPSTRASPVLQSSRLSPQGRGPALHPALMELERQRSGSNSTSDTVSRRGVVIRTSPQQRQQQP